MAIKFVDVMADFWQFWSASEGPPDAEKIERFRQSVVAPYQTLFDSVQWFEKLLQDEHLLDYFTKITPLIDQMKLLDTQLRQNWASDWAKFIGLFPDMAWSGTVYMMPSLFCFDGRVQEVGGQVSLLLGVDVMAWLKQTNLTPFLHHEWTHLYHAQVVPDIVEKRLFWALWSEGLAVYVSRRLNLTANFTEILLTPELVTRTEELLPKIAAELLDKIDSEQREDYADFFFGRIERTDIPARSGYHIGLRVVTHLSERYTLPELLRLTGDPLRHEITVVLKTLTYCHS
ncbi:MAG: hypothetical protein HY862_08075 [Chloroflexi bacterium]|nr:hypothetical protein [Chloroflexota bacterium]